MNTDQSAAIKVLVAVFLALMLIGAGVTGRPGSILASLIDAEDMQEVS